jgi:hypothetical protein
VVWTLNWQVEVMNDECQSFVNAKAGLVDKMRCHVRKALIEFGMAQLGRTSTPLVGCIPSSDVQIIGSLCPHVYIFRALNG